MSSDKCYLVPAQKPVDNEEPTIAEKEVMPSLVYFIEANDPRDNEEMISKRQEVLHKIEYLICEFVRGIAKKKGEAEDEEDLQTIKGMLAPYGSYRLGVVSQGSDIDCICVAPQFVERKDFFSVFFDMLKGNSSIKDLLKIENAYSPIMSMKFDGIELDISFAQIAQRTVNENVDFESDEILENIDDFSVRSLNGRRVNDLLLKLVPDVYSFLALLRFTRIWAKRRCVYGNVFGYLGGVNLAILAAFICQRYPRKSPAFLILKFFSDLATWEWPAPIYINTPTNPSQAQASRSNWDQSKPTDHKDLFPIITPSFPTINSFRSATKSTKEYLLREFKIGEANTKDVIEKSKPWDIVVQNTTFFIHWRKFVEVQIWAENEEKLKNWHGFVQSRIRNLAISLENSRFIEFAFPFPKGFSSDQYNDHPHSYTFYIALKYHIPKTENVARVINISVPATQWVQELKKSENFQEVSIQLLGSEQLPTFVFPNGERPQRDNHISKAKPN